MAVGDIILSDGTFVTPEDLQRIATAVTALIASTQKDPGQYEEISSLQGVTSLPVFQVSGAVFKLVRVAVSILKGMDGKEIHLQSTATHLQWRWTDGMWTNLIAWADLKGDTGETPAFRTGASGIEWKYQGEPDTAWKVLVSYDVLKLKFADLTPGQIAEFWRQVPADVVALFQQPATEAAAEVRDAMAQIVQDVSQVVGATNTAKDAANTAAGNANTKAGLANSAATAANAAKDKANTAAGLVDTAITNAATAANTANTAAGSVNDAKTAATKAATAANTAAGLANTAVTNANTEAVKATTAAGLANTNAGLAQTAAARANTAAEVAESVVSGIRPDWDELNSGSSNYIANKPALKPVATSGSYNDLSNKPTIPAAYTHPTGAGNNHIPTGGDAGQFLKWSASGTAVWDDGGGVDAGTLDGLESADFLYKGAYNNTEGILVVTKALASDNLMCYGRIVGNAYSEYKSPIDTIFQFYNSIPANKIVSESIKHHGFDMGKISAFIYNDRVCLFIPYQLPYQTIRVFLATNRSLSNQIDTVTNQAMPTSGVTRLVEIVPAVGANLTSNVASATKLQTARTIQGVSFDGTTNITLPNATTTANGLMSNTDKAGLDFFTGSSTATESDGLNNLPITKRTINVVLGASTPVSLASPLQEGQELLIRCVPSRAFTQPLPNTGAWTSMSGASFVTTANKPFEISIWCYKTDYYSVVVRGQD